MHFLQQWLTAQSQCRPCFASRPLLPAMKEQPAHNANATVSSHVDSSFVRERKNTEKTDFQDCPRDWVGGKFLFMCFLFVVIPYGREKTHDTESLRKSLFMFFVRLFFRSLGLFLDSDWGSPKADHIARQLYFPRFGVSQSSIRLPLEAESRGKKKSNVRRLECRQFGRDFFGGKPWQNKALKNSLRINGQYS